MASTLSNISSLLSKAGLYAGLGADTQQAAVPVKPAVSDTAKTANIASSAAVGSDAVNLGRRSSAPLVYNSAGLLNTQPGDISVSEFDALLASSDGVGVAGAAGASGSQIAQFINQNPGAARLYVQRALNHGLINIEA